MKLTTRLHLAPRSKNAWSYTSILQYAFMALCSVYKKKHRVTFTFTWVKTRKILTSIWHTKLSALQKTHRDLFLLITKLIIIIINYIVWILFVRSGSWMLFRPPLHWSSKNSMSFWMVLPSLFTYCIVFHSLLTASASYFCNFVFLYLIWKPLIFPWSQYTVGVLYSYSRWFHK
jgi:hypothetical protein